MNIDYAAIIEKANQRKDTLQQLTGLINESGVHLERLDFILAYMAKVNNVYRQLDSEGRALLPAELKQALEYAQMSQNHLTSGRQNASVSASNGLAVIAKHREIQQ